jgi:hypothetical protein
VFEPEDGARVGDPTLLESPNVEKMNPTVALASSASDPAAVIPAPSVFFDPRGEVHNLRLGGATMAAAAAAEEEEDASKKAAAPLPRFSSTLKRTRYNVLYTRSGMMRSGDVHRTSQHDFVLDGAVNVWTLRGDGSTRLDRHGPGSYVTIPPYTPHVFEFLEDSAVVEWWDADAFEAWYYRPYRDVVEANNRGRQQAQATAQPFPVGTSGRLVRYAPVGGEGGPGGAAGAARAPMLSSLAAAVLSWKFWLGAAAGLGAASPAAAWRGRTG